MKKPVLSLIIVSFVCLAGISMIILFYSAQNSAIFVGSQSLELKNGYKFSINENFNYKFQHKDSFVNEVRAPNVDLGILGGNFIHSEVKGSSNQIPGTSINVYSSKPIEEESLIDWYNKVSTTDQNLLTQSRKYLKSFDPLVISSEEIFAIDTNPVLNGYTPLILIKGDKYLFEIRGIFQYIDSFLDTISTFEYLKDGKYVHLSTDTLKNIKDYYLQHEN